MSTVHPAAPGQTRLEPAGDGPGGSRRRRGAEAVVEEAVHVSWGASEDATVREVRTFGVLALALVGVLVSAQGLGRREIPAAVVAFEPPMSLLRSLGLGRVGLGRLGRGTSVFQFLLSGFVSTRTEFDAEEANGLVVIISSVGCRRACEGELGEGIHTHEVMGLGFLFTLLHATARALVFFFCFFFLLSPFFFFFPFFYFLKRVRLKREREGKEVEEMREGWGQRNKGRD